MTRGGKRIAAVIAVLLLAVLVYDSIYTIDESEQGVLTHFGKIAPPVKEPACISSSHGPSRRSTRLTVASIRLPT